MRDFTSRNAQLLAYEKIRENILNGTYPGGMKVVEVQLAEEVGVSRTPVREAIRRLEQEGLIKRKKIIKPDRTDLLHLFEMRMLIECHAVKMAALHMSSKQLSKLQACLDTVKSGGTDAAIKANKQFHDIIMQECNNPIMIHTVNKMQAVIHLCSTTVVRHARPNLNEEHAAIYEAIAQRNPDSAAALMKAHLKANLAFTLAVIE